MPKRDIQKIKQFQARWLPDGSFYETVQRAQERFARTTNAFFQLLIQKLPKTEAGLVDLRGYPFWDSSHEPFRASYSKLNLKHADFSDSTSLGGHIFDSCRLVNCMFDHSKWYDSQASKTKFVSCSFDGLIGYGLHLGWKCQYETCTFRGLSGRGTYFSFGSKNEFWDSLFENIEIRCLGTVHKVDFYNCQFSGLMRNGHLEGPARVRNFNFSDFQMFLDSLLFGFDKPVQFHRCDLTGLTFEKVQIDADVFLKGGNRVPESLRTSSGVAEG